MAKALLSKISSDFLECKICLVAPFKDPKILSCLHTFCKDCLEVLVMQQGAVNQNRFECPTCREETVLPKAGIAGLTDNFFVVNLSDTVKAHQDLINKEDNNNNVCCDRYLCKEVAVQGCVACEEFLCDECACAHRRSKRTRGHEVVSVADMKEILIAKMRSMKSASLPIRPKHQEEEKKMEEEEEEMEDGDEATFSFTVKKFSQGKGRLFGPAYFIHNMPWKIMIMPTSAPFRQKSLGVFLQCDADYNGLWSCRASGELRLVSQKYDVQPLEMGLQQIFSSKNIIWGFSEFMVWQEVLNPNKGYITEDDSIVLEAHIKVEAPLGQNSSPLRNIVGEAMSQAEATFRFTVENFDRVRGERISPAVFVRNLPWKIVAEPERDPDAQTPLDKNLAVFLRCDADSNSLWSCRASVELRLIPQRRSGVQAFTRKVGHVFYRNEKDWGFTDFMPWHEVCDPQNGYIKDNKIVLEAYVKADPPHILA